MSEPQYYSKPISVTKDFLINTHAHPLLAEIKGLAANDEFYLSMWKNTPDPYVSAFGGVFGTQFKSIDELQSFNKAFDAMLTKHKIGQQHRNHLLYLIKFYGEDAQKESIFNAKHNRLLDYTRFILDLYKNSEAHISSYRKNKA